MIDSEDNKNELLFHTIENINLQLAVIDNLLRENIIPVLTIDEIAEKISFDLDNADPDSPIDEIERYLYSMDIEDIDLLKLTKLSWGKESIITKVIWPAWKGDDNYFHIDSLEGIEMLPNIRSITGEYFRFKNAKELPLLSYLGEVKIDNSYPVWSLESFLDVMDLKVLHISAESNSENFKIAEELEVKDLKIVWMDVSSEEKARRIYDQVKYYGESTEEKLDLLTYAIEICPTLPFLYKERGEILFHDLKNIEEAFNDIEKAIELSDQSIGSYHSLRAEIYTEMGEYEKAVSDYSIAIENDFSPKLSTRERGKIYRLLRDYDNAIKDYSFYFEAKKKDNEEILLEFFDKKFFLEMLEIHICTNNYEAIESLIQKTSVNFKFLQPLFDLFKYITDISKGKEKEFNPLLPQEKKLALSFIRKWDYSHLELWLDKNGFEDKVNNRIAELIEIYKGTIE